MDWNALLIALELRPKPSTNSEAVLEELLRAVEATRASSTKTPYQRMGLSSGKCLMGLAVCKRTSTSSQLSQSRLQMVQRRVNNFAEYNSESSYTNGPPGRRSLQYMGQAGQRFPLPASAKQHRRTKTVPPNPAST